MPNVFEVLLELHDQMVNDEDKRLIREKRARFKTNDG